MFSILVCGGCLAFAKEEEDKQGQRKSCSEVNSPASECYDVVRRHSSVHVIDGQNARI